MHKIYIRKLRFEDAKKKFLNEIEKCFARGVQYVEVIHGIGSYILRNMVIDEINKINYVELASDQDFNTNPGSIKLIIRTPEKSILNKYIINS